VVGVDSIGAAGSWLGVAGSWSLWIPSARLLSLDVGLSPLCPAVMWPPLLLFKYALCALFCAFSARFSAFFAAFSANGIFFSKFVLHPDSIGAAGCWFVDWSPCPAVMWSPW